jgi:hypothetical protein
MGRDLNDVLRERGGAVRKIFDEAKVYNGKYTPGEIEHAIRTLPKGWVSASEAPNQPVSEYVQGALGPGTAMLVGPSSAGKTTLSCGLGYAIATGNSFFGRRVIEPMGVAHILGEGVSGISRRYDAIRIHTGDHDALPIAWRQNKSIFSSTKIARR